MSRRRPPVVVTVTVAVAVAVMVTVAVGCGRSGPRPPSPTRTAASTDTPSLSGGQSGEDGSGTPCWPTWTDGADGDVVVGAGGPVTAQDLRGFATGGFTGVLGWSAGGSTPLTVDLAWPGPIHLVDGDCDGVPDHVSVGGAIGFTTGDGALAESGAATLTGAGPGSAQVTAAWTEGSLAGSFVFPDDGGRTSVLALGAAADADGVRGALSVSVQLAGGSGGSGTAGQSAPIATFTAARP